MKHVIDRSTKTITTDIIEYSDDIHKFSWTFNKDKEFPKTYYIPLWVAVSMAKYLLEYHPYLFDGEEKNQKI